MSYADWDDWKDVTVCLSVRQPWAWLLCAGLKDLENRTWHTPFRGRVLIHAGKAWGKKERQDLELVRCEFGLGLDVVPEEGQLLRGGIVGGLRIVDCVIGSESPWAYEDSFHFVCEDAVHLPFVPMRGALGFFTHRDFKPVWAGPDDRAKGVGR